MVLIFCRIEPRSKVVKSSLYMCTVQASAWRDNITVGRACLKVDGNEKRGGSGRRL